MKRIIASAAGVALLHAVACTPAPSPTDEPEYPCCVDGELASCHGDRGGSPPFTACPGGRCALSGQLCPAARREAPASPDAGPAQDAAVDASALEEEERTCDLATGRLDEKLEAARACTRDAECVVVSAACVAPCGRPLNAARVKELQPELDALRDRCQQRCGKAKCAAWVANQPVCRAGRCEIPH